MKAFGSPGEIHRRNSHIINTQDLFSTIFSLETNFLKISPPRPPTLLSNRVRACKNCLGLSGRAPALILCGTVWALHTNLQFGLVSLFLHDFENHAARFRGPLWGGMDGDGLLCGPRVLLPMDVYPVGKESGAIAPHHLG